MRHELGIGNVETKFWLKNLLTIAVGSLISAMGMNIFLVPHKFLSGGVTGLSQLMSYLTSGPIAAFVIVFNIPVFIFGWRYVGRSFIIGSIVGTLTLSLTLYLTAWMANAGWAPEPMLSALVGGAMSGGGTGLVFRANSSHGGTDIIAAAVKKRWSLSIGTVVFAFNAVIVLVLGFIYGLHASLYTVVAQFCSAMVLDHVMLGLNRSRAVFIVTAEPHRIADMILRKLNRGVTFLEGEGAYLHQKKKVVFCVVSLSQLARVKYYVQVADPYAFMIVAEAGEVHGKGFKSVPV
jgi:uncharacterized membrane-anchored protein YitT (DUF2179 family)